MNIRVYPNMDYYAAVKRNAASLYLLTCRDLQKISLNKKQGADRYIHSMLTFMEKKRKEY